LIRSGKPDHGRIVLWYPAGGLSFGLALSVRSSFICRELTDISLRISGIATPLSIVRDHEH
jgi:hypothetical protein